uniref:BED-type domain-containing protein n=1 Tax=Amphimedon queenslandica TaxID=400682 RepID=A0A1X7SH47_AMPQE
MAAQSRKKRSPIWDFFTVAEDTKFAQCNTCTLKVSRGGKSPKDYNTTNLKTHLKSHSSEYAKYEVKCQENKSVSIPDQPVLKQLSLKESKERSQAWDINDARAQRVHRRIVDMIALDCQPFSVVEDLGFIRLLSELQP